LLLTSVFEIRSETNCLIIRSVLFYESRVTNCIEIRSIMLVSILLSISLRWQCEVQVSTLSAQFEGFPDFLDHFLFRGVRLCHGESVAQRVQSFVAVLF
jgi:hypothetical protein